MIPAPNSGTARLLVGLGNPGPQYTDTRHNVGFVTLDLVAQRLDVEPTGLRHGGQRIGDLYRAGDDAFALLWPLTYMNLSGRAVAAAMQQLKLGPESLFVVLDDFHLELGALRIRPKGSPGGHNGLKSIEQFLGTSEYARLRIGVGMPKGAAVDHVLNRFRRSEQAVVEETLETASFAAEDWIRGISLEEIQTKYNRRTPQAGSAGSS
ncbi:MAG: aminoacyl-tRNA hydrolase [Planctomycetota bacterium]|nr:MAG: aminoacyl-tRNA hydrolase [Planctomycetota bacterium]